jgi:hypothetical protein
MAQLGIVRIYPGFSLEIGSSLPEATARMLYEAWRAPGYCVPNAQTYPHQWLWDSCFHALIWTGFHPERGVREVESALAHQLPSGFVPHMTYWQEPESARAFWGRGGTSTITQPPMYGHAVARLGAAGVAVPPTVMQRAAAGLLHLLESRTRTPSGLVAVFHPWETGCDDSPRWCPTDDPEWWRDRGRRLWRDVKHELVRSVRFDDDGTPVDNRGFVIGSVGFSALVAWNARELASVMTGEEPSGGWSNGSSSNRGESNGARSKVKGSDASGRSERTARRLRVGADRLARAVAGRWDRSLATWTDEPVSWGALSSHSELPDPDPAVRTLDAMLALLIDHRADAVAELADGGGFNAGFGPRGVHRDEPGYDPDTYWRGPAWPQLGYLIWVALARAGSAPEAEQVRSALASGADRSGLAEFWNPDTGVGRGARPQTWTGLGLVAERAAPGLALETTAPGIA